jgi:hypothetical protein
MAHPLVNDATGSQVPRPARVDASAREHDAMSANTGQMEGHGVYSEHSLAQHSAGEYGLPALARAVDEVAPTLAGASVVVVADLGAAGGRNELRPLAEAITGLRAAGVSAPVAVVHTDIPSNDFTTLFETVEHAPNTYLGAPDVFAYAAGRSFYERLFPERSLALGWSAIAVHWLSSVPVPIPDHVYCSFATGASRDALAAQSARDWRAFLDARAAELRPGGQLVVVGGAARDDSRSGAEALMDALDQALRAEVQRGALTAAEYEGMTVPTWNRTRDEFAAPFADGALGLQLVESELRSLPDPYLAAYRESGDAAAFGDAVSTFLRAFSEPSLFDALDRPAAERTAIADRVYASVREKAAADPPAMETIWHVVVMRIVRPA